RAGIEASGDIAYTIDPNRCGGAAMGFTTQAAVTPYAGIDGFIEAGIDLLVVEIGIGGTLELVTAELPATFDLSADFLIGIPATQAGLHTNTQVDFFLKLLSGRVYVFADTLWKTYKKTIFKFDGPEFRETLFKRSFDENIITVVDYCDE